MANKSELEVCFCTCNFDQTIIIKNKTAISTDTFPDGLNISKKKLPLHDKKKTITIDGISIRSEKRSVEIVTYLAWFVLVVLVVS